MLKLQRSPSRLVQAVLYYWGNHLKAALEAERRKQSVSDLCKFIGNGTMVLTYVDDVLLFFRKDRSKDDAKIKALEAHGFIQLTEFEDYNGAPSLALSPKNFPRTKHIAIKHHHFCESVGEGKGVTIVKINAKMQKVDMFTKGIVGGHAPGTSQVVDDLRKKFTGQLSGT